MTGRGEERREETCNGRRSKRTKREKSRKSKGATGEVFVFCFAGFVVFGSLVLTEFLARCLLFDPSCGFDSSGTTPCTK